MKEWYLINPQPTFNSGFEYEEFDDYSSDGFDELLGTTPLGKDVMFCRGNFDGERFEEETQFKAIVQSETPDAYTQGWQRQLLTRISDEVRNYKYIRYDGKIWLIMTMPSDNTIYDKCVIHLCNYVLKWQSKTGVIYCRPTHILDATQYNSGVQSVGRVLQTGYIQLNAWLAIDNTTAEIKRDMRMFIDISQESPETYIVTSTSKIPWSYGEDRVMRITFTECEYNPDTDRKDLLICDYVQSSEHTEQDMKITHTGNAEIRTGGFKSFSAESNDTVVFKLVLPEMLEKYVSMVQNENTCKISVKNFSGIVGSFFRLEAEDSQGKTGNVTIDIIGGV